MTSSIKTTLRLLSFRLTGEELRRFSWQDLITGLLLTWLVGMGRWWEDPNAKILQHLGVGSVAYVFVLATFLWLLTWPLSRPATRYFNLLTFITLTAPPAVLYTLPVRTLFALSMLKAFANGFLLWLPAGA